MTLVGDLADCGYRTVG